MADISHKTLSGTQLHENKGVSTASNNDVATCTASATVWQKLTHNHLTTTGNSFGGQLFHTRMQQTSGSNGGSITTAAWTKYPLLTSVTNEIASATLSGASVISLPAGTYRVRGEAQVKESNGKLRLRNTSDSTTLVVGMNTRNSTSIDSASTMTITGTFTLGGTKNIELQYWISNNTGGSSALGAAITTGEIEVYGDLQIWRIA